MTGAAANSRSSSTSNQPCTLVKTGFLQLIKRAFRSEPRLHPIDHQMAKRWIKQRLVAVFPELRNNPKALERAYQSLGLDPREGQEEGETETVFEMSLPDNVEER
jgi:hypothetical protein